VFTAGSTLTSQSHHKPTLRSKSQKVKGHGHKINTQAPVFAKNKALVDHTDLAYSAIV